MGATKNAMMDAQDLQNIARELLVEAGAARRCPHDEVLMSGDPDAEKRALELGFAKCASVEIASSQEDLEEAMQKAIKSAPAVCPSCERAKRD